MADYCLSEFFPPTEDDLPRSSSSPEDTSPEPAEAQTTSEPLAASLPDPPTTEPRSAEEPIAKKQKVAASSDEMEKSPANNEDEFEGFADEESNNEKTLAGPSQGIEEGWEEVRKDEVLANIDPDPMPLEAEPVQVEGTEDKMAIVLEANGEVASHAPGVFPNILTRDW